jgi:hypothetical protein
VGIAYGQTEEEEGEELDARVRQTSALLPSPTEEDQRRTGGSTEPRSSLGTSAVRRKGCASIEALLRGKQAAHHSSYQAAEDTPNVRVGSA